MQARMQSLKSELNELENALSGQGRERTEERLDANWPARAGELGSQIAPLFR